MDRLMASSLLLPHQMNNPNLPQEHSTFNYNRRLKIFQKVNLKTFEPQIGSTVISTVIGGVSDGDDDGTIQLKTEEQLLDDKLKQFSKQAEQIKGSNEAAVKTFKEIEPVDIMEKRKSAKWVEKQATWNNAVDELEAKHRALYRPEDKYYIPSETKRNEVRRLIALYNKVNLMSKERFKKSREKELILHLLKN